MDFTVRYPYQYVNSLQAMWECTFCDAGACVNDVTSMMMNERECWYRYDSNNQIYVRLQDLNYSKKEYDYYLIFLKWLFGFVTMILGLVWMLFGGFPLYKYSMCQ